MLLLSSFYVYHMDISLNNLPGNDLAGHIAAFHDFKSQWMSEGTLPLWAPKRFCGMVQGLSLGKFLVLPFSLFLSEIAAHKAVALLALAFGVLGTYRVLRLWGLDRTSGYIGGLVFAIHPFVLVDFRSYGHLSFTLTLAVLPFYLYEICQILSKPPRGRSVFLVGFLLAFIFAIHLTMAVMVSLMTVGITLPAINTRTDLRIWCGRAALIGVLIWVAFAVSAFTNLPFWIEARSNMALLTSGGSAATLKTTYPVRSIIFFFNRMGVFNTSLPESPSITASYLGWGVFLVTLIGAILHKKRTSGFNLFHLGVLWLILAWMALGNTAVVDSYRWFAVNNAQNGARLTLLFGFALVLWGFAMIFSGWRRRAKNGFLKYAIFCMVVIVACWLPGYVGLQTLIPFFREIRAPSQFLVPAFVLLPILFGAAVYEIRQHLNPSWRKAVTAAIVVLVLVDFFPYRSRSINEIQGLDWPNLKHMAAYLRDQEKGHRVSFSYAYSPVMDYAVMVMARKGSFSYWLNWAAPRYMGEYREKMYEALLHWRDTGQAESLKMFMAIADIHFLVNPRLLMKLPNEQTLERRYRNMLFDVYEFKGAQGEWQIYPAEAAYSLSPRTWEEDLVTAFHERRALLADERNSSPSSPGAEATSGKLLGEIVQWSRPASTRCWAEVEFSQPAILMWSESFHPGWRVRLDGEEVELLRVNHAFMGVRVPPGTHRIIFEFGPYPWRWIGVIISLASLAALVAISWFFGLRRKRLEGNHFNGAKTNYKN